MIRSIFAQLSCSDEERSLRWFTALFARAPDSAPMPGLHEWHHGETAGLQLFASPADAGHGTVTLIVSGLDEECARLRGAGLDVPDPQSGDAARFVQLDDPDGNRLVLAEPL